jgi:hypothetical protein
MNEPHNDTTRFDCGESRQAREARTNRPPENYGDPTLLSCAASASLKGSAS